MYAAYCKACQGRGSKTGLSLFGLIASWPQLSFHLQARLKKRTVSPARHSSKDASALRSPRGRGRGRQSPRGRGAASPRRGKSPERPSGKATHRVIARGADRAETQRSPGRASEKGRHRQHSSSARHSPVRHSSSAERSTKKARLSRTPSRSASASGQVSNPPLAVSSCPLHGIVQVQTCVLYTILSIASFLSGCIRIA